MIQFKIILVIFFLILLVSISCNDNSVVPEEYGYVKLSIIAKDSIIVKFDENIIIDGRLDCDFGPNKCFNWNKGEIEVGLHTINFVIPKDNQSYENTIYIQDTVIISLAYYLEPDSTKYYDFDMRNYL